MPIWQAIRDLYLTVTLPMRDGLCFTTTHYPVAIFSEVLAAFCRDYPLRQKMTLLEATLINRLFRRRMREEMVNADNFEVAAAKIIESLDEVLNEQEVSVYPD